MRASSLPGPRRGVRFPRVVEPSAQRGIAMRHLPRNRPQHQQCVTIVHAPQATLGWNMGSKVGQDKVSGTGMAVLAFERFTEASSHAADAQKWREEIAAGLANLAAALANQESGLDAIREAI